MDENEVSGIAKSIAKWTNEKFSESKFEKYVERTHHSKIQSKRGSRSKGGGRPKLNEQIAIEVEKLRGDGIAMREISTRLNISLGSTFNLIKKGISNER